MPSSASASITVTACSARDLADLQIGARGHVRIAAAVALGDVGDARELPMREDAVRDAQAAHVGVLRRRDVKQPVEAPTEIVDALGVAALRAFLLETRIGIEGMLVALGLLLGRELLARGLEAAPWPPGAPRRVRWLGRAGPPPAERLQALRGAAACTPETNPSRYGAALRRSPARSSGGLRVGSAEGKRSRGTRRRASAGGSGRDTREHRRCRRTARTHQAIRRGYELAIGGCVRSSSTIASAPSPSKSPAGEDRNARDLEIGGAGREPA